MREELVEITFVIDGRDVVAEGVVFVVGDDRSGRCSRRVARGAATDRIDRARQGVADGRRSVA